MQTFNKERCHSHTTAIETTLLNIRRLAFRLFPHRDPPGRTAQRALGFSDQVGTNPYADPIQLPPSPSSPTNQPCSSATPAPQLHGCTRARFWPRVPPCAHSLRCAALHAAPFAPLNRFDASRHVSSRSPPAPCRRQRSSTPTRMRYGSYP